MTERLVPTIKTPVSMQAYARALARAWRLLLGAFPTKAQAGVLWAQYGIETGAGPYCWGWNIGNVKHVHGDGYDYQALAGVWEGFSIATANALIASGQATRDPSAEHQKAVGAGRMSVVFSPKHPASWFRVYPNLDAAMTSHLSFLRKRFATAWTGVEAGDCTTFARALKAGRDGVENTSDDYFTADAKPYAAGMLRHFAAWMQSKAFEDAMLELLAEQERPTEPELDDPPSTPTVVEDQPIVRPRVPLGRPGLD